MPDLNEKNQEIMGEALKSFQKAFNAGYELKKHEPELLEKILKSPNQSQFIDGMKAGSKQHEKDKFIDQMKQFQERTNDKGREI